MPIAIALLTLTVAVGLYAGFNRLRRVVDSQREVKPVPFFDAFSDQGRSAQRNDLQDNA